MCLFLLFFKLLFYFTLLCMISLLFCTLLFTIFTQFFLTLCPRNTLKTLNTELAHLGCTVLCNYLYSMDLFLVIFSVRLLKSNFYSVSYSFLGSNFCNVVDALVFTQNILKYCNFQKTHFFTLLCTYSILQPYIQKTLFYFFY